MQLTILPVDGFVGKNNKSESCLGVDLTSCNIPANVHALQWDGVAGYIEFNTPVPNEEITVLPGWASCCITKCDEANQPPPAPTPEEIIAGNKAKAERLLLESDWSVLLDVPLANKTEWETYRSALRQIAINPTIDPVWPVKPQSIWS
jgi:hypothetical protein